MANEWNVKVDEIPYSIKLSGTKVIINDEKTKLKNYFKKTSMLQMEYEFPVGSKQALLVSGNYVGGNKLIIDGKDCATGEDYVPLKMPKWAYIFIVLHFVNFINGVVGIVLAFLGIAATAVLSCNRKIPVVVRVLLDFIILIVVYVAMIGIATALATLVYSYL